MDDGASNKPEIVIIRRRSGDDGGAHKGGSWKIAYADFVTAMMAFFIVMWLINAANEKTLSQVASYFNPIKLTDSSTGERSIKNQKVSQNNKNRPEGEDGEESPPQKSEVHSEAEILANPKEAIDRLAKSITDSKFENAGFDNPVEIAPAIAPDKSNPGIGDPFDPRAWEKMKDESVTLEKAMPITESNKRAQKGTRDRSELEKEATAIAEDIAGRLGIKADALPPTIEVKASGNGVMISLIEGKSFEMFETGSAEPTPDALKLVSVVAEAVKSREGTLVIRGHTDSRPYRNKYYDNWQLSTARAHFARYLLLEGGLTEDRIQRVEGVADREPKNPGDPQAPENRRIDIFLGNEPS